MSVAGALYTIDTEDSFDVDGASYEIASTTLEVDDGTDAREFLFFFNMTICHCFVFNH